MGQSSEITAVFPSAVPGPPDESISILGTTVNGFSAGKTVDTVAAWARAGDSRFVCAANVHVVMEGRDCEDFRRVLDSADITVADGKPLVWWSRLAGRTIEQVRGIDLMLAVAARAARDGLPIGLFGSTVGVLERIEKELVARYPDLKITFISSPPFRTLSSQENEIIIDALRRSEARIVFVGLGCPKQERWIAYNKGRIPAVMLGVGAAFDFLSGEKRQAPRWMIKTGLEWLFRLASEPLRLWKRYAVHNPRFLYLWLLQVARRSE